MNKKGSLQDVLFIIIALVGVAVVSLLVFKVSDELNQRFQDSTDVTPEGKDSMNKINNIYSGVLDNTFMLLVIGLSIAAIVLASLVRVHPAFLIFFMILLVIIIFLGGVFSNIYQKVASNVDMDAADGSGELLADRLTFMSYTMRFLPFLTGLVGFIMAFVMYKSSQNG